MGNDFIIDLRKVVLILRKHIKFIIGGTLCCFVLGIIYLLLATPLYQSQALLRVKPPQDIDKSLLKSTPLPDAQRSKLLMTTYTEILKSSVVIDPVLEKMRKEEEREGQGQNTKYNVSVATVRDTDIIRLSVQSDNASKAQRLNDMIVKQFLHHLTELAQNEDKKGRSFIEKRRGIALKNLTAAEKKLSDFQKRNNFINPNTDINLIREQKVKLDRDIDINEVNFVDAQARLNEANSRLSKLEHMNSANDLTVQYEQKISELTNKRLQYLETYGEWHSEVAKLDDEIVTLKARLDAEVARIADLNVALKQEAFNVKYHYESEVEGTQSRLKKLYNLRDENTKRIKKLADMEQQYNVLTRNIQSAKHIYDMLNNRLEEARVAEASFATEVQLLSPAKEEIVPIKPKKNVVLAVAIIIGLIGSCGYIIAKESFHLLNGSR